jgi:hypothetical protein
MNGETDDTLQKLADSIAIIVENRKLREENELLKARLRIVDAKFAKARIMEIAE